MAEYIATRIVHVSAILSTQKLYIAWECGDEAVVDFSEMIAINKHCRPLSEPSLFQSVKHVDCGTAMEWRCGIDMGSDQIRWMADQQNSVFHKNNKKSA